jgi:hypothetical protein
MPQYKVGDVVKLKSGPTATITAVRPDGTYDWEPTKGTAWGAVEAMTDTPVLGDVAQTALDIKEKGWGQALPAIGGMVGSLVGGKRTLPGIAAAGAGGAVGEVARQAMSDQPWSLGGVALEAAKQAGLDVVGRGMSGGLRRGAPALYQSVAKPSLALRREFPEAVPQAIKDAVLLTKGGADKARLLVGESSNQAAAMLSQHPAPPIPGQEVTPSFQEILGRLSERAKGGVDVTPERNSVASRMGRLVAQPARRVPEANTVKQEMQSLGDAAMRREERGAQALGIEDELNMATGRGYRKAIESRVPEVGPINQQTQNRMGVSQMVDQGVGREGNNLKFGMRDLIGVGTGGGLGYLVGSPAAGVAAYGAQRLLSTPASASTIAVAMDRASRIPYAQLMRAIMLARLGLREDGTPEPER